MRSESRSCSSLCRPAVFSGLVSILFVFFSFAAFANGINTYQQELIKELKKELTQSVSSQKQASLDRSRLLAFYEQRNFQPVWLDDKGPLPRAAVLRQVLNAAGDEGLDYETYHPLQINMLWRRRLPWNLAELELLLSDALFRYIVHVQTGYRTPHIGEYYWDLTPPEVDASEVFNSLLKSSDLGAALFALAPAHEGYLRLRKALKQYYDIQLDGGWPLLPATIQLNIIVLL